MKWLVAEIFSCLGCPFRFTDEHTNEVVCKCPNTLDMVIIDAMDNEDDPEPTFPDWCVLPEQMPRKLKEVMQCGPPLSGS
jgi:hypothetical protein